MAKITTVFLSLLLAFPPAFGQEASISISSSSANMPPLIITAPGVGQEHPRALKRARIAGGITAAGGAGLMTYAVMFDIGSMGLASFIILIGGLTAYLAHRRLHGIDDFPPDRDSDAPVYSQPPEFPQAPPPQH